MGTMINITDDSFQEIFLDFIRESFKENCNNYEYCSIAKVGDAIVFSPQNSDSGDMKTLLEVFQKENEELKKKLSSYEKKRKSRTKNRKRKNSFSHQGRIFKPRSTCKINE